MDGAISIFDIQESKRIHSIQGNKNFYYKYIFLDHAMTVRSITFSRDSSILLTASDDMQIKLYDM